MQRFLKIAATVIASLTSTAEAQTYQTGLADLRIETSQDARGLQGFLWYPTRATAPVATLLGNPVWAGIDAVKDAKPAAGRFPLVVLSHGMYGNAMNQAWLATALAQRGYIVAAISHPGTSTWLRDAADAQQLWQRPKDISRVIDDLLATPDLSAAIDPDRIFMAGHSLGGYTAMELAGARYDGAKFDAFCAQHQTELVCGIFDDWQVAKTPADLTRMQADLSDPRIKAFAVFDLGGTQTFSTASLAAIQKPLLIFGAPNNIHGLDLDVESRALVANLPADAVSYHEPATLAHFDFLGECTPQALTILQAEEPDDLYVCADGTTARHAKHQMIISEVDRFFAAH